MAGSDPSIYNQLGANVVQPINGLAQMQQGLQAQAAFLNVQQLQARQAAGQAFQQSIGPDGTTDQSQLLKNLASNPQAAMAAQDSAQQGQTLSAAEYGLHTARLNHVLAGGAALIAQNPQGVPQNAINDFLGQEQTAALITPQERQEMAARYGSDPAANSKTLLRGLSSAMDATTALNVAKPPAVLTDVGPGLLPTQATSPFADGPQSIAPTGAMIGKSLAPQYLNTGGANVPTNGGVPLPNAPPIPNTPTVADRNQMIQTFNPVTRKYEFTPRPQVGPMYNGDGSPAAPSNYGLPTSARVQQPSLPPLPQVPVAGIPAPTASAPATPTGPAAQPAPVLPNGANNAAGPALGQADEIAASVAHASAARDQANGYTQRVTPLLTAYQALQGADTGKGAETLNSMRSYVQDIAPSFIQSMLPTTLTDPQRRAAFEEANKYLQATAIGQPGASGSDARLNAAQGANASVHISNVAAQAVQRAVIANQRMTQAGTLAFNQSGQPAGNYDQFMNAWNTQQDPRGYVADLMPAQERAAYVSSLGGVGAKNAAYQKFKNSYQQGLSTQVVPQHGQ